jgi:LysR family hydrogen peroxide-inducible transcriptional activator
MDLRQLAALVAIADHRSFSAAARSLHTVQSNVSTHVARLERELGAVLVDRSTGSLTPEGEAVVERARRIHLELDAIVTDVAALRHEVRGVVRMGVIGTTARWLVPRLLQAMADRYPKVHVVVVDATTTSLLPQAAAGRLDLAVIALPAADPDVETEPLFEEELLLVAPIGHPLAAKPRVSLRQLAAHPLLMEPRGTAFRDDLDAQAERVGVTLEPQAEVDGMRLLASLAFEGFGPAVLPASAVPYWLDDERWRRVAVQGLAGRQVGLAWRRRGLPSAATRAAREVLVDVIDAEAPAQPGIAAATTRTTTASP